jgi:hypothetical protein
MPFPLVTCYWYGMEGAMEHYSNNLQNHGHRDPGPEKLVIQVSNELTVIDYPLKALRKEFFNSQIPDLLFEPSRSLLK